MSNGTMSNGQQSGNGKAKISYESYVVNYNANGGSGSMSSTTGYADEAFNLSANAFSKTGYHFTGWNSDTISVDGDFASGGLSNYNQNSNGTYPVTNSVVSSPSHNGKKSLRRYRTGLAGTGTSYWDEFRQPLKSIVLGGKYRMTYWCYAPDVSFNVPSATWSCVRWIEGESGFNDYGSAAGLPTVANTWQFVSSDFTVANSAHTLGYIFFTAGRNIDVYYSEIRLLRIGLTDGQSVTNLTTNSSVTLYAQWAPNQYDLRVDPNGGTVTHDGVVQDSEYLVTPSTTKLVYDYTNYQVISWLNPARTGYAFDGWWTAPDGGEKVYGTDGWCVEGSYWNASQNYVHDGDLKVYAHWIPNSYTIHFNANGEDGATGIPADISAHYDTPDNVPSPGPDAPTMEFAEWNTKADGTGTSYGLGDSLLNLTDADGTVVTLYAQWDYIVPVPTGIELSSKSWTVIALCSILGAVGITASFAHRKHRFRMVGKRLSERK